MSIKSVRRDIKYWFQRRTRGWSDDETYVNSTLIASAEEESNKEFISKYETWNLDWEFFRWVNSRFKQYRKDASDIVDLEFYKFKYKGKEYTQLELINRIIKLTNKLIDEDYFMGKLEEAEEIEKTKDEVFDIFKLIFFSMWW